jgi:hypothetical protein
VKEWGSVKCSVFSIQYSESSSAAMHSTEH